MSCLRESIRRMDGDLPELLAAVENAPTLAAMMLAAWHLGRAIAVAVVEDVLNERAQRPTEWPLYPKCGKKLESKGFDDRSLKGLIGYLRGISESRTVQLRTKTAPAPIQIIAQYPRKRQPLLPRPLNHLQAQLRFGGKLSSCWQFHFLAQFCVLVCEPPFGNKQFAIHQRPQPGRGMIKGQIRRHLAQINLAQPSIALSRCANTVFSGLSVSALVQDQDTPLYPRPDAP